MFELILQNRNRPLLRIGCQDREYDFEEASLQNGYQDTNIFHFQLCFCCPICSDPIENIMGQASIRYFPIIFTSLEQTNIESYSRILWEWGGGKFLSTFSNIMNIFR